MAEPAEKTPGLLGSLRRLLRTALSIAHNRLELVLVELLEERTRLFEAFLLAGVVLAFGAMALVMITFTVVAVFWENHRVAVLVSLGFFYLVVTLVAYWRLRHRLKHWPAFSATVAELKKDKAWLDEGS